MIKAAAMQEKMISIHASRGGSDDNDNTSASTEAKFQSTLPAGEATKTRTALMHHGIFQSTLPAGEATAR